MSEGRQDWQDSPVKVVMNDEEQYSIWPIDREPPLGWREVEKSGTKDECLGYIAEIWKDLRPKTVRQLANQLDTENERPAMDPENPDASRQS